MFILLLKMLFRFQGADKGEFGKLRKVLLEMLDLGSEKHETWEKAKNIYEACFDEEGNVLDSALVCFS